MSRKFLEEVGNKYLEEHHPEIPIITWKVEGLNGIKQAYVIEHNKGEEFLLGRGIYGAEKFQLIQWISWNLLCFTWPLIKKEVLAETKEEIGQDQARQFIILRGAYPFDLQNPWQRYAGSILSTSWTKLQRKKSKQRGKDKWEIEEEFSYGGLEGKIWLVPDTAVASGSTVSHFLRTRLSEAEKNNKLPETVMLYTACGSLLGVKRASEACQVYGVDFIPVFSQAIFEVSPRGNLPGLPYTDLPIENEGTITSKRFYKKAHKMFQGKPLCTIGDIGEILLEVEQYFLDTFWEIAEVGIDPTKPEWEWLREIWNSKENGQKPFRKKLADHKPYAAFYFKEKLAGVAHEQ